MSLVCLPEHYKIVHGTSPVTTNGGVTAGYVSLKNVNRAYVLVSLTQAASHTTAITIEQATAVAGTSTTAITNTVPIWANEDTDTSDTLTRQTDAVSYTVGAGTTDMMIVFQIDPAGLADGYECITAKADDSSEAANFITVTYLLDTKYKQATPPAAITD
jgi:hypothetical protein